MITLSEHPQMFRLLSSMYICKPTKEAIVAWRDMLNEKCLPLMCQLQEALDQINIASEQELEDVLWEYTRLFIGPYKLAAPPWESVYTSPKRLLMQEAHDKVSRFYDLVGLEIGDPNIMLDDIGVELNFISILGEKIVNEEDKKDNYREVLERFCREHLEWVSGFTKDLEAATESPLYKALAKATREAVSSLRN